MFKSAIKNGLFKALRSFRKCRTSHSVLVRDKAIVKSHPEWSGLDTQEKSYVLDKDIWQYIAYKNVRGSLEEGYVSDVLYSAELLPILNSIDFTKSGSYTLDANIFSNKCYFPLMLKYLPLPKTVVMNINGEFLGSDYELLTEDEALRRMDNYSQLVFKPAAGTGHGTGVALIAREYYKQTIDKYGEYVRGGGGYIVQEVLKQHESFSRYNPSSVNVIRITTLFWKSEIYILSGILRVGAPGEFCDHTTSPNNNHPRVIALNNEGRLIGKFIDPDLANVYDDCYGVPASGVIPKYREMKELVAKEHSRFPQHRILGWDITLDEGGNIVCIEYNASWPGIIQTQYALGPVFMQKSSRGVPLLHEILSERV